MFLSHNQRQKNITTINSTSGTFSQSDEDKVTSPGLPSSSRSVVISHIRSGRHLCTHWYVDLLTCSLESLLTYIILQNPKEHSNWGFILCKEVLLIIYSDSDLTHLLDTVTQPFCLCTTTIDRERLSCLVTKLPHASLLRKSFPAIHLWYCIWLVGRDQKIFSHV